MTTSTRTLTALVAPAIAAVVLLAGGTDARAQGVSNADPTTFAFRLGPLLLTPGLQITEIGADNNVFNEAVDPKQDYVIAAAPDLTGFMRLRFMRISFATGAEFTYFREYTSERSVGQQMSGRIDFLLGRLQPFVNASRANSFARPNKEVDARAEHLSPLLQAGVSYELSPTSNVFAGASRSQVQYRAGETFANVALDQALNHRTDVYDVGLFSSVTPLTSIRVTASYQEEIFDFEPERNSTSRVGTVQLQFGPDAIFRGNFSLGFRDFKTKDPEVRPYQGLIATGTVTIPVLDRGSLLTLVQRDVQTSFDKNESYFVNSEVSLTYTHRVLGPFDLQVTGAYGTLGYGKREGRVPKKETMQSFGGGLGYNLRDQSRLGLNYEQVDRRSNVESDRAYAKNRVYGSWTYRF